MAIRFGVRFVQYSPASTPFVRATIGLVLLVGVCNPVYAYLDPGTGNIILQAILASLAAAAVSLKLFGQRIIIFFKRIFSRGSKPATPSKPEREPDQHKPD